MESMSIGSIVRLVAELLLRANEHDWEPETVLVIHVSLLEVEAMRVSTNVQGLEAFVLFRLTLELGSGGRGFLNKVFAQQHQGTELIDGMGWGR